MLITLLIILLKIAVRLSSNNQSFLSSKKNMANGNSAEDKHTHSLQILLKLVVCSTCTAYRNPIYGCS